MHFASYYVVVLAFAVALIGALGGLWFSSLPHSARVIVPFSGGLLVGVALLGLLPEIVEQAGWWRGVPVFAAGYLLLLAVDRNLHVDANVNSDGLTVLHGFITPLLIAAVVHAFLDGWGLVSVGNTGSSAIQFTFPVAVMLHKAPEGLALGAIFRASSKTRWAAFGWCAFAESATLVGGWAEGSLTRQLGSGWTYYPLASAGGCFLYLGYHAIRGELKISDNRPVWVPALAGLAGSALVQQGARIMGR